MDHLGVWSGMIGYLHRITHDIIMETTRVEWYFFGHLSSTRTWASVHAYFTCYDYEYRMYNNISEWYSFGQRHT